MEFGFNCRRSGGDDRLRLHGRQWSSEPQRTAARDGDRTNVSRPAARDRRLRDTAHAHTHVSDIAIFVLKRDVKLQLTN